MQIVILDGYTENPGDLSWDGFKEFGEVTVYDRTPPELVLSRIGNAEIVLTNKTPLSAEAIQKAPNLAYIGVLATGYNVVDVEAAKARHIPVANIPTYGTDAVAQFAMALLLELCHHIGLHSDAVHNGDWSAQEDFCFWKTPLLELSGKTLGIIGYGKIGRRTAEIARAFGMNILAYDLFPPKETSEETSFVSLDELLANADVISLHCPLFPETKEVINKDRIAKMKDGAMIINTSRGPLIQETDLKDALVSGKLAGAALDVVSEEPISRDNPLLSAPNCIITPHIAWAARESRSRLMDIAVSNLKSFLSGSPANIVNS